MTPDETREGADAGMNPEHMRLFHDGEMDRLRLTIEGDRSYVAVKPVWAAPLTRPNRYLALLDGKGNEITVLADPSVLDSDSRKAVQRELYGRYLTATISKILQARQEFGSSYWTVESDRGTRDFVTQSLQENAQWLTDTHLLLIDVDGNRFEILDTAALDDASRKLLYGIV